ncbi:MAG: sugar phosphate isomerase/epimerase [Acidobacteriota bacterium]|nr:sugar phosphate isomerase/epimerase [Acidobacteriota bacterium]
MQAAVSTHVFLQQRLHPGLLDAMRAGGATCVELFAARHHFDYTDRAIVREIANWFRDTGTTALLHQPIFAESSASHWSRHVPPTLNLIDPEKARRIDAMDEVKRALESAEQIPIAAITLHLGLKGDAWNLRAIENSLTAIEHVKAFAHGLGVKVLLENLPNEVTTPEHLLEILHTGHFDTVGLALDLGHAHLTSEHGIDEAIELLRPRVHAFHLHDNNGLKDDHLWPNLAGLANQGSIAWANVARQLASFPADTPAVLEISHELNMTPEAVTLATAECFARLSDLQHTA